MKEMYLTLKERPIEVLLGVVVFGVSFWLIGFIGYVFG
jgi:hypothetical protein